MANEEGKVKLDPLFEELRAAAKDRDLFDVYDSTAMKHFEPTILEGYFRTFIVFLIQVLAPPWVVIYTIQKILTPNGDGIKDPNQLCIGKSSFQKGSDVFTKFVSALFVFFITVFINKSLIRLRNKPTYKMFVNGFRFKALMYYQWSFIGIVTNFICAILCLVAGLAIIYQQGDPAGIVLNAMAIFFLLDVDNSVVAMDEAKELVIEDDDKVDFNLGKSLKYLSGFCFGFLHVFFYVAPVYTFVCKEGFEIFQ